MFSWDKNNFFESKWVNLTWLLILRKKLWVYICAELEQVTSVSGLDDKTWSKLSVIVALQSKIHKNQDARGVYVCVHVYDNVGHMPK